MTDSVAVLSPADRITSNGASIVGAKLKFYDAGTTNPKTVYNDSDLTISLGTTVYTDSDGYPVTAFGGSTKTMIYTGTSSYKIIITDSSDTTLWTMDNIRGAVATTTQGLAIGTIVSASTTDIGSVAADYLTVTGTATITSFGTVATVRRILRFGGACVVTYNATTLILPGAANITTASGDVMELVSDGSGNWTCVNFMPAAKAPGSAIMSAGTVLAAVNGTTAIEMQASKQWRLDVTGTGFSTPALGFRGDTATGIGYLTTNTFGAGTNGVERVRWDANGETVSGAAGKTSFTGTRHLGLTVKGSTAANDYSGLDFISTVSANANPLASIGMLAAATGSELHFGVSGAFGSGVDTEIMVIDKNAIKATSNGSQSAPSFSFVGANGCGMYAQSSTTLALTSNGADSIIISSSGTQQCLIPAVWSDTTVTAANVNVASTGRLRQSTSSARFKRDIEPMTLEAARNVVLNVAPIYYRANTDLQDDDPNLSHYGLLAEQVAKVEPRLAGFHDAPGEGIVPWSVQYERFVAPLILVAQDQERRLVALEGGTPIGAASADMSQIHDALRLMADEITALKAQNADHAARFEALSKIDLKG